MFPLIAQLSFIAFTLALDGELFRLAFLRRLGVFSDLNIIEKVFLDIHIGWLAFYLVSSIPIPIFNQFFVLGFTIVSVSTVVYVHRRRLADVVRFKQLRTLARDNVNTFFDFIVVLLLFLFLLLLHLNLLSGFVFGSIFDESIHALKVEVILEKGYIPLTLEPYLSEGVIYPQAAHTLFAFAQYLTNMGVPEAVFYVTLFFKSLSVVGAYFLGRRIGGRAHAIGLSFVFAFASSWPLYVVWGSNPFLTGFPLFLASLGLIFSCTKLDRKYCSAELAAIGLLFGFAGAIVVSFIQTLIAVGLLMLAYFLVKSRHVFKRKLMEFFEIFLAGLIPLFSLFYRFVIFYPYPGHNVGIPADFVGYETSRLPFSMTQALEWAYQNLSPHLLIRWVTLAFIAGLPFLFFVTKSHKDFRARIGFASCTLVAAALLSLASSYLPGDLEVISWGHQGIIIAISVNVLILAFFEKLVDFYKLHIRTRLKFLRNSLPNLILLAVLLGSLSFPFVYYRCFVDPAVLAGTYGMFAVTTTDDLQLMTWMKTNLPKNSTILVSLYEPGLFIPAISHHKIVYPYTASAFSLSYQSLMNLLIDNVLNGTTYSLMSDLPVSHVFVGADAGYWFFEKRQWNYLLFLGNPNFQLVKNVNNAYLFKVNPVSHNVFFLDDFNHLNWDDNGWQAYSDGNGATSLILKNSSSEILGKCLMMESRADFTVVQTAYASYIARKIFLNEDTSVNFSFQINAFEGFSGEDTFAVLVSNLERNQSVVISTPNGVYKSYSHLVTLDKSEGDFSFNLSSVWEREFSSQIPSTLILEFANWDFDGIGNEAYIDNIVIESAVDP